MEKEIKPRKEFYEFAGSVIEIDNSYPYVAIYSEMEDVFLKDSNRTFFDSDLPDILEEYILILQKGLKILQNGEKEK